jgi:hypothetical protein
MIELAVGNLFQGGSTKTDDPFDGCETAENPMARCSWSGLRLVPAAYVSRARRHLLPPGDKEAFHGHQDGKRRVRLQGPERCGGPEP